MSEIRRGGWRPAIVALVTGAILGAALPVLGGPAAAAAAAAAGPAPDRLLGAAPAATPGVTPAMAGPRARSRAAAVAPAFTLRQVDSGASAQPASGYTPQGEGGGYACSPYVDWSFGDVGEDDYLEETVTVDFYGDVTCNFYLWSIDAAAGVYDRSPSFNGQNFDGTILAVGPTYHTEWDYYAYSYGGFGVQARLYNGARRVEPAFETILEAPEGFVWDSCEPLSGLRYLVPCEGLGTNTLHTLVGAYDQGTGLTRVCRDQASAVDVEQARVTRTLGGVPVSTQILRAIPAIKDRVTAFKRGLCGLTGGAAGFAGAEGQVLWDAATAAARAGHAQGDDRPLYWARLSMTRALAQRRPVSDNAAAQAALERSSRGMASHAFTGTGRKVFVSGFDPFSLDTDDAGNPSSYAVQRGNPSAAAVLRLDGTTVGGAEVQAVVFPVRYADFAAGMVEQVFTEHVAPGGQQADLVTTVSQGSPGVFDLEFYNGRNRATNATDNRDARGGGSRGQPIVPAGMPAGEQFVQTTLPVDRMRLGTDYPVRVNTEVREQTAQPPRPSCQTESDASGSWRYCSDGPTLGSTAVEGGGGSYLSNEIAYRVTRLRDQYGVAVQAGHVHTPTLCFPGLGGEGSCSASQFGTDRGRIAGQYRQILEGGVAAPGVPAVRLTVDRAVFEVGQSPVYTVTGGPNAPVEWSGVRDGLVVERDLSFGHTTDAAGTWTGSWHQWLPSQVADWVRYARVGGRLARVAMTVQPAPNLPPYVAADFDADDRTDVAVWRPTNGTWYVQPSGGGYTEFAFGLEGDLPVDADFDGDGRTDYGVFRPSNGTWYVHTGTAFWAAQWGTAGDVPVPADYDRDGRADVAVWRPSDATWWVLPSSGSSWYSTSFGLPDDRPVPGDYDGDDRADIAVFRPGTGTWYVQRSSDGQVVTTQHGGIKDITVAADYDGDGRTDIATFRRTDGVWQILQSSTGTIRVALNGSRITTPAPGDYDGDGRADFATFTPSSGYWRIVFNAGGSQYLTFGQSGDIAVPSLSTR